MTTTCDIIHGDALEELKKFDAGQFDAIITDPPYALSFMGKDWDSFADGLGFQEWCEQWAAECLRVAKPGAHLLAFGGTRTYHREACAIEDAGWEIRDSLHWIYGQGFPKSLDVSRAIGNVQGAGTTEDAARWDGWGTALKPAHEPIVVARKPLTGTVAANVLKYGVGALNINGCRVGTTKDVPASPRRAPQGPAYGELGNDRTGSSGWDRNVGRWPPNIILTHSPECAGNCAADCPVAELGGASRFFPCFRYQAKAPRKERPTAPGVIAHPAVKPVELMRWLVRLVTPPGGLVLDPFAGTGTTAEAAILEGFNCVLVERDADYIHLIDARMTDEDAA